MNEYVIQKFIAFLTIVFEMFIVYMYVSRWTSERRRIRVPHIVIYFLFGAALMGLEFFSFEIFPNIIVTFAGVFLLLQYTANGSLPRHIFSTTMFVVLMALSEALVAGIIMLVVGADINAAYGDMQLRLVGTVISKLIQILLVKATAIVIKRQSDSRGAIKQIALLAACQAFSIYIVFALLTQLSMDSDAPLHVILLVFAVLYINIIVYWYYDRILQVAEMKHQSEALQLQIESSLRYYDLVRKQQEALDSVRHDIQKHMNVMKEMIQDAGSEDPVIQQYLDSLSDTIDGVTMEVHTPNPVVSAILRDCAQWAARCGIILKFDVSIYEHIGIDDPDITVVLGNTIENAKHALERNPDAPNRELTVILKQREYFLYYEISNTFDPTRSKRAKNGGRHYGLTNVRQCAEKYGGRFETNQEDGKFTVRVTFQIPNRTRTLVS